MRVAVYTDFSYKIDASNNPTSFSIVDGRLPDGLDFDTAAGVIWGTTGVAGDYTFTVGATNAAGTGVAEFEIQVVGLEA